MGASEQYGQQKHWLYGDTFDGLNKQDTGGNNLGPTADFIFPQDKALAGICYGGSDGSSSLKSNRALSGTSSGSSSAQISNGTAATPPGGQKYWLYGETMYGLPKNDFGSEKYWVSGLTDGSLFAPSLSGVVYGASDGSSTLHAQCHLSGTIAGSATASLTRIIPIDVNVVSPKHNLYGLTFMGLNLNAASLGGQKYWINGMPETYIFPTSVAAKKPNFVHSVRSGIPRKRSHTTGNPGVKVISPYYQAAPKQ